MTSRPAFSTPITASDGTKLVTVADALDLLAGLPRDHITAPIYYAHVLLNDASRTGYADDIERARSALIEAFGGQPR